MKQFLTLTALTIFLFGCGRDVDDNLSIAKEYLAQCKESNVTPRLGEYGWNKVESHFERKPELQILRDQFEKDDRVAQSMIMRNDEVRKATDTFNASQGANKLAASQALYKLKWKEMVRLRKESEEYRIVQDKREASLYEANIQILESIIDNYEQTGIPFPETNWTKK